MVFGTGCPPGPVEPLFEHVASRVDTGCRRSRARNVMPWRVSDRATFDALRTRARRARHGSVKVSFYGSDDSPVPRVAYAVGRRTGGAVVRNRLRRRLRAAVTEVSGQLKPGAYLVSAGPEATGLPYEDLKTAVADAMRMASRNRTEEYERAAR
jgi:ribonuclease P protein component